MQHGQKVFRSKDTVSASVRGLPYGSYVAKDPLMPASLLTVLGVCCHDLLIPCEARKVSLAEHQTSNR
jgi:hypothetical protein